MRWIKWESETFPPNLCSLPVDKIYCLRRRLGAKRHVAVGNILDNIYRQYTWRYIQAIYLTIYTGNIPGNVYETDEDATPIKCESATTYAWLLVVYNRPKRSSNVQGQGNLGSQPACSHLGTLSGMRASFVLVLTDIHSRWGSQTVRHKQGKTLNRNSAWL